MTTIREILQQRQTIEACIEDWGFYYPRLFKSLRLKEKGILNILVNMQPGGNIYQIIFLQRALENRLGCPVYVFLERQLEENGKEKILTEAICLNKPEELLAYYGDDYEFSSIPSHSTFDIAHGQILLEDFKKQRLKISSIDNQGEVTFKDKQKIQNELSEDDRRVIDLFKTAGIPVDVTAELSKYDENDEMEMSLKRLVRSQLELQVKDFLKIQYSLRNIASTVRNFYEDRTMSNNLFNYCETLRKEDKLTGNDWQKIFVAFTQFLYEQSDQFPERKHWFNEDQLKLEIKKLYDHHCNYVSNAVERLVQIDQAKELRDKLAHISQAIEEADSPTPGRTDFFEEAKGSSSSDRKRKYDEFKEGVSAISNIDPPRSTP